MRNLELLAPARNADIGIAAIDCGADAVYIAGPAFGARRAAGNDVADLRRLCDYAHMFGARVFITLNTILYDSELEEAERLLTEVRQAGADAVIVQDMALLRLNAENAMANDAACNGMDNVAHEGTEAVEGRLPLHASTQCAIRTPQKAAQLESLGFSRLILERELSLSQIRSIASAVDCEIECFVHGALCVCYSGQCYMSEMISGRSANRGACIQACRSRYDLTDRDGRTIVKDKALLSLRDFNLMARLGELADAGVTSFKIEGRLKNISYVRNVVRAYSLALDKIVAESGGRYRRASFGRVRKGFIPDVDKTFNRGYTELFFDGKRGKWAAMDAAKGMGEALGTVTALSPDCTRFTIRPAARSQSGKSALEQQVQPSHQHPSPLQDNSAAKLSDTSAARHSDQQTAPSIRLANGDGLAFVSRSGEILGIRADVCNGLTVKCKRTPELYNGALIFRNFDSAFEKEMAANPCVRLLDAEISAHFTAAPAEVRPADTTAVAPTTNSAATSAPASAIQTTVQNAGEMLTVTATTEDGRTVTKCYTDLWTDHAANPDRMRSMFATQLSKASGIFQFHFTALATQTAEPERLPLLSAASLNFIRNDIAATLAAMPCHSLPLYNAARHIPQDTEPYHTAVSNDGDQPHTGTPNDSESIAGAVLTYKDNVANKLAEKVLSEAGFTIAEPAYELTHRKNVELMRTKYCIRHELGLCPKQTGHSAAEPLYLINNGRRLAVLFDCRHCEMTICSAEKFM